MTTGARSVRADWARSGVVRGSRCAHGALVLFAGCAVGLLVAGCSGGPGGARADAQPVNTGLNRLSTSDRPVANVPTDLELGDDGSGAVGGLDERVRQQALDLEALLAGTLAADGAASDAPASEEGAGGVGVGRADAGAARDDGSLSMGLATLSDGSARDDARADGERVDRARGDVTSDAPLLASPGRLGATPDASLGLSAFDDSPRAAAPDQPVIDAPVVMDSMETMAAAPVRASAPMRTPLRDSELTEAAAPAGEQASMSAVAPVAQGASAGELAARFDGLASQGSSAAFREALVALGEGLRGSGIAGGVPARELDASLAAALSPAERQTIDALRALIDEMRASSGDPALAADAFARAAGSLRERVGVRLPRAVLCRKVDGFGSYVPFERDAFLAGRANPALVYVEVDRFTHRPATRRDGGESGDGFAVELTQELLLHHKADGRLAWRMPAQRIVDTSRNRRQDFYLVTRVDLPANLSVGSYELKVVVTDATSGTTDETIVPIGIVADPSLAAR